MAGHNKWSKIKHKKAASDAKKSQEFSKLARLITVESKKAGGNVESPALRAAIEKARAANMPKDNITRAVEKGHSQEASTLESLTFETYGPGGCAVIAEAVTDNRNRTNQEIKHLLNKAGCQLATPGSATWAFHKPSGERGWEPTTTVALSEEDGEKLGELLEALEEHEDVQDVYTNAV